MKRIVNLGSHIERLKSWTNGVVVFAIASLGSQDAALNVSHFQPWLLF